MKQLTNDTKQSLISMLLDKVWATMAYESDIDELEFECIFNNIGLTAEITVDYAWHEDGNQEETGPLFKNTIGEIIVGYSYWTDRSGNEQPLTEIEEKEIVVYLQANL